MQSQRLSGVLAMLVLLPCLCAPTSAQSPVADSQTATQKLGAFLGQWETEAVFMGSKATSKLECRWSPRGNFLICEQLVTLTQGQQMQLTVYSWNAKEGAYTFSTFSNPGEAPSSGQVAIDGNRWTYSFSFEQDGKKMLLRTINEFTAPGVETFRTERSDDGGAHWTVFLEGKGHRVGK